MSQIKIIFFIAMPIIIAIITTIDLIYNLSFWENIWSNIERIGALATALAFGATAWAAYEARRSANLSFEAQQKTSENNTKIELDSKRNVFEQRFSLMLEQHNIQLGNVKAWLDDKTISDTSAEAILEDGDDKSIHSVILKIRGHEILSPYMRILYHLLKHVNNNYPRNEIANKDEIIIEQKQYTSIIRSFIPNKLLLLVSFNCSITVDEMGLNNSSDFKKYQCLLNKFDFFQHLRTDSTTLFSWGATLNYIIDNIVDLISRDAISLLANDLELYSFKYIKSRMRKENIKHSYDLAKKEIEKYFTNRTNHIKLIYDIKDNNNLKTLNDIDNLSIIDKSLIEEIKIRSYDKIEKINIEAEMRSLSSYGLSVSLNEAIFKEFDHETNLKIITNKNVSSNELVERSIFYIDENELILSASKIISRLTFNKKEKTIKRITKERITKRLKYIAKKTTPGSSELHLEKLGGDIFDIATLLIEKLIKFRHSMLIEKNHMQKIN